MKLKHAVHFLGGGTPDTANAQFWAEGDEVGVPWVTIGDMSSGNTVTKTGKRLTNAGVMDRRLVAGRPGTVLFAMYASVGAVATLGTTAVWNQALLGVDSKPDLADSRFVAYWLRHLAPEAVAQARSATQANLNADQVANFPFTDLGVSEQRRIADFLDGRIARIDLIIAARGRQIALFKHQFQTAAEEQMWRSPHTMPLKHLLMDVTSGPRGWGDLVSELGNTPFVRIGNLSRLGIELIERDLVNVVVRRDAEASRAALTPGDVLLSITAAFGEVAVWRRGLGSFSQHVARLRPTSTHDSEWIAWLLQTLSAHDQYRLKAYGGTKIGMGLDQVSNLLVPVQSAEERLGIAASVAALWANYARRRSALTRSIDLLIEYKSSLITAAVTGELDVTTAGSGIPG